MTGVEEVNMFKEDGNVIHFPRASGESKERGQEREREEDEVASTNYSSNNSQSCRVKIVYKGEMISEMIGFD